MHAKPLLDTTAIVAGKNITVIRDATEAAESLSLLHHLIHIVTATSSLTSDQILFISTRTRTSFKSPTPHIYPKTSSSTSHALTSCTVLDPYLLPLDPTNPNQSICSLVNEVDQLVSRLSIRVVFVECMYSLRFVFGIHAPSFVRTLTSLGTGLSVIIAAPTACGIDNNIFSLIDIADTVIDLSDLNTGVAIDIDGLIRISKQNGQWATKHPPKRFKVTNTAFNIYN